MKVCITGAVSVNENCTCDEHDVYGTVCFREVISKCSNEVYNKFPNTRQHNKYLLQQIGYMFRPVNRSSSGLQQNKSKVLLRNWNPNIFYSCKQM